VVSSRFGRLLPKCKFGRCTNVPHPLQNLVEFGGATINCNASRCISSLTGPFMRVSSPSAGDGAYYAPSQRIRFPAVAFDSGFSPFRNAKRQLLQRV